MAALSFVLCSCSYFKEELPQQSINDRLQSMVSYEATGTLIRISVKDVSVLGRSTQGVTLMRTNDGGKVVSIELVEPEENND